MNSNLETNQTSFGGLDFGVQDLLITANTFSWEQAIFATPTVEIQAMPSLEEA